MKIRIEVFYSGGSRTAESKDRVDLRDAASFLTQIADANALDSATLGGPPGDELVVAVSDIDRVDLTWEA